jgi:hypothetical protein
MAQKGMLMPSATENSLPRTNVGPYQQRPYKIVSVEELGKATQETLQYIDKHKERLGDGLIIAFMTRKQVKQTLNTGHTQGL